MAPKSRMLCVHGQMLGVKKRDGEENDGENGGKMAHEAMGLQNFGGLITLKIAGSACHLGAEDGGQEPGRKGGEGEGGQGGEAEGVGPRRR